MLIIALPSVLAACSRGEDAACPSPESIVTRAMTHEDSIAAGLIITVENDGEWDGEDEHDF